jgi:peptidoglycan/LPS O-acetylase OafA/YrhL
MPQGAGHAGELGLPTQGLKRSAAALPALTGVRGVAALAVFLCHLQPIGLHVLGLAPDAGLTVIGSGFRGVDLFFILSGFILFHVHAGDFDVLSGAGARRFYVLRFFRVYPLNAFVLTLMAPLVILLPEYAQWHRLAHLPQGAYHARDFSLLGFVQSLLLVQSWTELKPGTWNEPAWTLSAEVLGYICFPGLAVIVGRLRSGWQTTALAALGLATFGLLMILGGHATNNPSALFGLVRMALCFGAGVCLCRTFQLRARSDRTRGLLAVASAAFIALCFWQTRLGVLSVFGFAGLIYSLACGAGLISSFMTSPLVMWLGRISFSLYIIHLIPLDLFDWLLSRYESDLSRPVSVAMLAVAASLPFALAAFTHRLVEQPFQRLGRRIAERAPPPSRARQAA